MTPSQVAQIVERSVLSALRGFGDQVNASIDTARDRTVEILAALEQRLVARLEAHEARIAELEGGHAKKPEGMRWGAPWGGNWGANGDER